MNETVTNSEKELIKYYDISGCSIFFGFFKLHFSLSQVYLLITSYVLSHHLVLEKFTSMAENH